ncbi:hypothetical protein EJ07DRAFT_160696 [Lizonia empirigonia]|nr:hypothetical protein EJ07DRAFT_160696 [Lizonia empirigonia]
MACHGHFQFLTGNFKGGGVASVKAMVGIKASDLIAVFDPCAYKYLHFSSAFAACLIRTLPVSIISVKRRGTSTELTVRGSTRSGRLDQAAMDKQYPAATSGSRSKLISGNFKKIFNGPGVSHPQKNFTAQLYNAEQDANKSSRNNAETSTTSDTSHAPEAQSGRDGQ